MNMCTSCTEHAECIWQTKTPFAFQPKVVTALDEEEFEKRLDELAKQNEERAADDDDEDEIADEDGDDDGGEMEEDEEEK